MWWSSHCVCSIWRYINLGRRDPEIRSCHPQNVLWSKIFCLPQNILRAKTFAILKLLQQKVNWTTCKRGNLIVYQKKRCTRHKFLNPTITINYRKDFPTWDFLLFSPKIYGGFSKWKVTTTKIPVIHLFCARFKHQEHILNRTNWAFAAEKISWRRSM